MTDHQKIHPVDIETAPSAPLVKHDSLSSIELRSPVHQFPPQHRTIPVRHSKPPKKRSCCCKFFCWTVNSSDNSLSAAFNVTITARNPNKKIGIYYKEGSNISVWYGDTNLCHGALPAFYQGHQNTTILNVALTGQTQFGSTLMSSLLEEQQQTGRIPLDLKVRVPVRVKFGSLKLRKVKFLVRCKLVVGNLTADSNLVSIRTSSCKFKLRL
ncbi:hypothetical protein MRB53_000455 [Persea americana]|uniref:Uncharacterized protein n=1 Tax=Persea americana TaxID=3435 RepID=A0ACC2MR93_PERAE|nr:hypothetical protein MRB53_000455 [Persea americana]